MDRLTTDNPQSNLMTALNLFYAKDGQAWVRGGGPIPDYPDVTLYDYTRATIWKLLKTRSELAVLSEDYYIQEIMGAWLLDGNNSIEGMIATLYTAGWAFAEIRARLSAFEDILGDTYDLDDLRELMVAEKEGRLMVLPCKVGDTIYAIPSKVNRELNVISRHPENNRVYTQTVQNISFFPDGVYLLKCCDGLQMHHSQFFRETWFLTQEEAEAALAKNEGGL